MPPRTRIPIDSKEGFGRAIRALRAEQNVSQEDLADRCEMSRAQLSKVERGLADLRLSTVFRLASAFDVPAAELIGRTEDILKASSKRRAGS